MIRRCNGNDFDAVLRLLRQLWPDRQLDPTKLRVLYESVLANDSQFFLCASEARI